MNNFFIQSLQWILICSKCEILSHQFFNAVRIPFKLCYNHLAIRTTVAFTYIVEFLFINERKVFSIWHFDCMDCLSTIQKELMTFFCSPASHPLGHTPISVATLHFISSVHSHFNHVVKTTWTINVTIIFDRTCIQDLTEESIKL